MNSRFGYLLAGTVLIAVFMVFSVIANGKLLTGFDLYTTVQLAGVIPAVLDVPFSLFSLLGSFEILTVLLLLILIERKKLSGIIIIAGYIFGLFIEYTMKVYILHPGPPSTFFRYDLRYLFPSAYIYTGHSYPSGHSFRTIFIAIIAIYWLMGIAGLPNNKKTTWSVLVGIFCFLMLISRVSLGEHWATDVIGGTLLGGGLSILAVFLTGSGKSLKK